MSSKNPLDELKEIIAEISQLTSRACIVYQDLEGNAADLERHGVIYEKGYWRNRKYFYLYSSLQHNEQRTFRYVGCNPDKIREAQHAIQRAVEYRRITEQMTYLEDLIEQCRHHLTDALRCLQTFLTLSAR